MASTSSIFYTNNNEINQSKLNKFTPPIPVNKKVAYDILDTSPIKAKHEKIFKDSQRSSLSENEENLENDMTVTKNYQFSNNFYTKFNDEKEKKFTSNSGARNRVKDLISKGRMAILNESLKPSLNATESRNKIFNFSTSKTSISYSNEESQVSDSYSCISKLSQSFINENNENQQEEDDRAKLLLEQQKALPVSIEKKNDERFKILKMKELKRASAPPNKSVKSSEDLSPDHRKDFERALDYSLNKKKKISHSVKKNFATVLTLFSSSNDHYHFPLYKDKEIGVYEYWQAHIIESKTDEDNDTDEEQLSLATGYVVSEMQEALDVLEKKGGREIRNSKIVVKEEAEEEEEEDEREREREEERSR